MVEDIVRPSQIARVFSEYSLLCSSDKIIKLKNPTHGSVALVKNHVDLR